MPIVRRPALEKYAGLRAAFDRLAGRINAQDMRRMNYAVDGEKKDASVVVRNFLRGNNL
jgi:osmoprotectant transport system substrate-binding protein